MTDETNGQAAGSAEGQQAEDTREQEFVTLADEDEGDETGEDAGESDEESGDEGESGEGEEGEAKPKPTRNQKRKENLRRLREENEVLRRQLQEGSRAAREPAESDDEELVEPKEEDFPNDYMAYQRALNKYDMEMVNREREKRNAARNAEREAERAHSARVQNFNRNLEQSLDRIPDYHRVIAEADAAGVELRDDVMDLVRESDKGPLLAYYLAKHPEKVAELNGLRPAAAAKEVGRLEARIRTPQPNAVTNARRPVKQVRGGGSAPPPKSLETMSMEEFYAHRSKG